MAFAAKMTNEHKDIPVYVWGVVVNHLSQNIDAMLKIAPTWTKAAFYMGISGVEVKDGVVEYDGVGGLAGPMKTSTRQEKDKLIAALSNMPPDFRAALDKPGDAVVIAITVDIKNIMHRVIIELSREELAALKAEPRD